MFPIFQKLNVVLLYGFMLTGRMHDGLIAETMSVVLQAIVSLLRAFVGNLFFFWPRKYKDISNDVVLVTGGGRGIGRHVAVEFAKRKPKQIIIWGRHDDTLSATAKAIQLQGVACEFMVCDVSDKDQVAVKAKEVKRQFGGVDILVNNAGVVCGKTLLESRTDEIRHTISVNLLAQFWTIKAFLPAMLANNHGHIVSINSMLGLIGLGSAADYSASKFGALGLHEALALELAREGKTGIQLTTIHPYLVNTDLFAGAKTRFQNLFPALNKDYVGWKIVNAVCTNQTFCIIPRYFYFFHFLKCLLPYETLLILQKFVGLDTALDGLLKLKPKQQQHR
jgi:short-subunit dehydrogenase